MGGTGGDTGCPDINCSASCPGATWPETDGCPSCACATDLEMRVTGYDRPLAHVDATVQASLFLGGIDRWVFDFLWQYDDPNVADEAEDVITTVRIMRVAPAFDPTATNVTYFTPEDDGNPLEVLDSQYTLYGFVIQTAEFVPVDGLLSIRRVSDLFEGHVSLDFVVNGGGSPETMHVASPFSVPVPWSGSGNHTRTNAAVNGRFVAKCGAAARARAARAQTPTTHWAAVQSL